MKQTFPLTILALILLSLSPSQAAAQGKTKTTPPTKVEKAQKATAVDPRNTSALLGTPAKILGTSGGVVYDVSALDGTTANPRTPKDSGMSVSGFIGFAFDGNNTLHGLTSANTSNPNWKSRIFTISPNNSFSTLGIGPSLNLGGNPFYCLEGDLAYDKSSPGYMYATCNDAGVWRLIIIKLSTGAVTFKGLLPAAAGSYGSPAYPALAFNASGTELYTLDTYNRKLYKLNKNNANALSAIPLAGVQPISSTTGSMSFATPDIIYASFGGKLVTISTSNGAVGVSGNSGSMSGLIVVSPGSGEVIHN